MANPLQGLQVPGQPYPINRTEYQRMLMQQWTSHRSALEAETKDIASNSLYNVQTAMVILWADFISDIKKDIEGNTFATSAQLQSMLETIKEAVKTPQNPTQQISLEGASSTPHIEILKAVQKAVDRMFTEKNPNYNQIEKEFSNNIQNALKTLFISELEDYKITQESLPEPHFDVNQPAKDKLTQVYKYSKNAIRVMKEKQKKTGNAAEEIAEIIKSFVPFITLDVKETQNGKKLLTLQRPSKSTPVGKTANIELDMNKLTSKEPEIQRKYIDSLVREIYYSRSGLSGWISFVKGDDFEKIIEARGASALMNHIHKGLMKIDNKNMTIKATQTGGESTAGGLRSDITLEFNIDGISGLKGISAKNISQGAISLAGGTAYKTIFEQTVREGVSDSIVEKSKKAWEARTDRINDNLKKLRTEKGAKESFKKRQKQLDTAASLTFIQGNALRALGKLEEPKNKRTDDFYDLSSVSLLEDDIRTIWSIQNARLFFGLDVTEFAMKDEKQISIFSSLDLLANLTIRWSQLVLQLQNEKEREKQTGTLRHNLFVTIQGDNLSNSSIYLNRHKVIAGTRITPSSMWHNALNKKQANLSISGSNYNAFDNYIKDRTNINLQMNKSALTQLYDISKKSDNEVIQGILNDVKLLRKIYKDDSNSYLNMRNNFISEINKFIASIPDRHKNIPTLTPSVIKAHDNLKVASNKLCKSLDDFIRKIATIKEF